MAPSNNERVGRGLDALKRGLGPYVLGEMRRHYGDRLESVLEKELDGTQVARLRQGDGGDEAFLEAVDVAALLKLMRFHYRQVFFDKLGHDARNYAHEAATARNDLAHQQSFTTDGAARALDTMARLLKAVSAEEEAAEVGRQLDAMRGEDRYSRDERYTIVRPLGSGGMAEVHLARDEELDREVALKYPSPQYAENPNFVERFEREAKSAASLSHPNIVAIHDRGQTRDGTDYIVMEYVPGETLKDYIRRNGWLSAEAAAEVGAQIAEALGAAHHQGVTHRDIKPQNILFTETGNVKVTDFGIARAASDSTITRTGEVLGSAHYSSPEQAMGEPADSRSDLYSLGVVLYEMLTGELPYDADTPVSVMMKHVGGDLRSPTEINPEIPESINALTVKLLSKSPEERHQSAEELIDDLEKLTAGKDGDTDVTESLPAELVVSSVSDEHFQTIGQALRQVLPGGRIRVRPGVYRESLVIDKPVEIVGERGPDGDVVVESAEGPCLSISADRGTLKDLVLRRLEDTEEQEVEYRAAVTVSAGEVTIEDCDITSEAGDCITVRGSEANPTVRNCEIHDGELVGVDVGVSGQGLVENCDISYNRACGVSISTNANPTIRSCKIHDNGGKGFLTSGVEVSIDGHGLVENCDIFRNVREGVIIQYEVSDPTIRNCKIRDHAKNGVAALGKSKGIVEGCNIYGNACGGIHILTGADLYLSRCTITGNRHEGVQVEGDSTIVTHENCNLEGNARGPWKIEDGAKVYEV